MQVGKTLIAQSSRLCLVLPAAADWIVLRRPAVLKTVVIFGAFVIMAQVFGNVVEGIAFDHCRIVGGASVCSTGQGGTRLFYATRSHVFSSGVEPIKDYIVRFDLRCNNALKSKRRIVAKDVDCPYHNVSVVEALIERNLKIGGKPAGVVDRFVVKRSLWRRFAFSYNDLVTVSKRPGGYRITYDMIPEGQAGRYIDDPVKFDSFFHGTKGGYELRRIDGGKTEIRYSYFTKTDHWLLSSALARARVYASIASAMENSIGQLERFISEGSSL